MSKRSSHLDGSGRHNPEDWAELVLPWLPPRDLASAAASCTDLRRIAASITVRRAADAAGGLENHPIPFINSVDSQPYAYFIYTPRPVLRSPSPHPWGGSCQRLSITDVGLNSLAFESGYGCDCTCCRSEYCSCYSSAADFGSGLDAGMETVRECGAACKCGAECCNRTTQTGVGVRLRIVKDRMKGWGLHAAQLIQDGEFVCEYAGEFLTNVESQRRQKVYDDLVSAGTFSPALVVVREHLPSGKACLRVNIDATEVGNVARFINHSCDGGNLKAVLVRESGSLIPRLCFFSAGVIPEGEELTFSYGEVRLRKDGLACYCGKSLCFGTLPSEDT